MARYTPLQENPKKKSSRFTPIEETNDDLPEIMNQLHQENQQPGVLSQALKPKGSRSLKESFGDIANYYNPKSYGARKSAEHEQRLRDALASQQFGLGALQGIADIPPNILSSLPGVSIPRSQGFTQFSPEGEGKEMFETLGKIAGEAPIAGAMFKGLNGVRGLNPQNMAGRYAANIGKGSLLSYLLAPEENKNAAAAVGAAIPAAGGALKGVANTPRLFNGRIGQRIINDANRLQEGFNHQFGQFFENAAENGAKKITSRAIPEKLVRDYARIVPRKDRLALNDFQQNNSLENAHWLQSDLNSYLRKVKGMPQNSAQTKAINAAEEMRTRLLNAINSQLEHNGGPELANAYRTLRNNYRQEMGPYLNSKAIRKARLDPTHENFIEAARLPSELSLKSNDSFNQMAKERYPELYLNRVLAGPIGKTGLGILGLGTLGTIAKGLPK